MTVCDICGSNNATHSRPVFKSAISARNMDLCYACCTKLIKAEHEYQYKAYLAVVEEVTGNTPAPEVKNKRWWQK
jgi:hypothetical protein